MPKQQPLTRRETLLQCVALGSIRLAPTLGLTEAISTLLAQERNPGRKPTQWNEIGPFYRRLAPNNPKMRAASDPGLPLGVSGKILDTRGESLEGAKIEIWQANHLGIYDLDGYRYRAALVAGKAG